MCLLNKLAVSGLLLALLTLGVPQESQAAAVSPAGGLPQGSVQAQTEEQEYKSGVHALKSEAGVYLLEHIQTDYFNGAFLTVSDGRILFPVQVLKDGNLLLEGCYITLPNGTNSAILALDADGYGLPQFRYVEYSARLNEMKAVLDKAFMRTLQAEKKVLGK